MIAYDFYIGLGLAAIGENSGANPSLDSIHALQILCQASMQVCTWDEPEIRPFDKCPNLSSSCTVILGFRNIPDGPTTCLDTPIATDPWGRVCLR